MIEFWKEFFSEAIELKYIFLGSLVSAVILKVIEDIVEYIDRRRYEIAQREQRERNDHADQR